MCQAADASKLRQINLIDTASNAARDVYSAEQTTDMLKVAVLCQGAGYRSAPRGRFDPLNQAASASSGSLDQKSQASPEEMCLEAEAKVHTALEQSAEALVKGDSAAGQPCRVFIGGAHVQWHSFTHLVLLYNING